ncbi:MAG TPA: adenylate/guanylate cyclase domain-containing protein [Nocardioidaceae bacterium]|nr:adenylate/guanylate cyclase domain-containing protein [Nocardioidaceae bacterium]
MDVPETRYARRGDDHIAYQTVGDAPPDIVLLSMWVSNVESSWDNPLLGPTQRRLSSFGRLIHFDKMGTGLSDPVPLQGLPTLEEWMDDLRVVLDEVESERPVIVGSGETGPMAILFASTYPERTSGLVLWDSWARLARGSDHPEGMPQHMIDANVEFIERTWGTGAQVAWLSPDDADDHELRAAWARYERQIASPRTAAVIRKMVNGLDVRNVLPAIRVPTLVIHHLENPYARVGHGRMLAERIPNARLVELAGPNWGPMKSVDREPILDEIEEFVTGIRPAPDADRVLATVLFTDVVGSTAHAAVRGDRTWLDLLERQQAMVRRQLERHRGREVSTAGDGFLATFDGPARAIRCADAIVQGGRALGIEIRAGLHTGEIELLGDDIGGMAVHITARVSALASGGEVLVSSTVRDLVVGSGIEFDDRGLHELKGVPGEWRLFAAHG